MSYNSRNDLLSSVNGTSIAGFRNRIINGDMRIDQANAGAAVSVAGSLVYSLVDNLKAQVNGGGGAFSAQQSSSSPPNGFSNYERVTVTTADASPAAGSIYQLWSSLEGYLFQDMQFGSSSAKLFTISFWARSSLTGTFSGSCGNGAGDRYYTFTFNIPSANTWTYITVTIQGDNSGTWLTNNGIGLNLRIDLGNGSNFRNNAGSWGNSVAFGVTNTVRVISTLSATFDLTGVQIEVGPIASSFEIRDFQSELARCQRYFCKSFSQNVAVSTNASTLNTNWMIATSASTTTNRFPSIQYPIIMRTTPAITTYNPSANNAQIRDVDAGADCSATTTDSIGDRTFRIYCAGSAGTAIGNFMSVHWTADARL